MKLGRDFKGGRQWTFREGKCLAFVPKMELCIRCLQVSKIEWSEWPFMHLPSAPDVVRLPCSASTGAVYRYIRLSWNCSDQDDLACCAWLNC